MDIKPTLLLAAALFLMSAPEPDARAVAEMTRNFIVPTSERSLQAAELDERNVADTSAPRPRAADQTEPPGVDAEKRAPQEG